MMKKACKRILSVLTAVVFLAVSVPYAAAVMTVAAHTHVYTVVSVVESGYMYGGYTEYRCECGDTYRDPISPRPEPYCILMGGRVAPGEMITVQAVFRNCSGLENMILDLAFNALYLTLEDVQCAAYGTPERIAEKALYFDSIDQSVQQPEMSLTFRVSADAPTGVQTVSVSGCGVSSYAADNGEEAVLTETSAELLVYRPFVLSVNGPEDTVMAGDTVQMTVDLSDNSGIAGIAFALHYDAQVLSLTDVREDGLFAAAGYVVRSKDYTTIPYRVLWDDAVSTSNHYENGTILTLTFQVRTNAPAGTTQVYVTFEPDEVLDVALQPVELVVSGAALNVDQRMAGDADNDKEVDLMDVTLLSRYIAGGWNVSINTRNCDVNGDGALNLRDVVLIRRYLADGWDVTLL